MATCTADGPELAATDKRHMQTSNDTPLLITSSSTAQWRSRGVDSVDKVLRPQKVRAPKFQTKFFSNTFPVTVKFTKFSDQTIECFIAALPT